MLQFNKILTGLKDFAESEIPLDLLFVAVNETKADFTNRAFNSETGSKDAKGKGLGKYSNVYASYRISKGKQIKNVDLEFTGSLRRDLKVIRSNDTTISMLYLSPDEQKKIGYLETNYKTSIFELSNDEQNSVFEKSLTLINREIKEIIENGLTK
jgi:hypothetical protein